jgi:hypothetical protein
MAHSKLHDEIGHFTVIPHEFIDNSDTYSDHACWLFILLRRYINQESGKAFPSYSLIQQKTGWSTKTIAKAIRELEQHGWIRREKQFSGPTNYIMMRPQSFPTEKTVSTSLGKESHFPTERTVLSQGKPKENDNKNTNNKKIERETRAREEVSHSRDLAVISAQPDAVSILLEIFPDMPIFSQEVIDAANITNLDLWRTICQDWRDNRYSTRNVTGMRDRYRQQLTKLEESHNGQNGIQSRVNRLSANERAARQTLALILGQPFDGSTPDLGELGAADQTGQQSTALRRR